MVALSEELDEALEALERAGLLRTPRVVDGPRGARVMIDGRELRLFCGNDYLGLAAHPALVEAWRSGASAHGVGAGASRLVAGTHPAHREAERALADLVGAEDALLFSSGYAANVGALPALLGRDDIAFSDALNHASLIDGLRLSRARVVVYPHRDAPALEALLESHRREGRRALVVTDAVFSMEGTPAPLRELRALADRHDAHLYVDEAHSLGVVGPGGLAVREGVEVEVRVGTLGKSVGVSGAFVAGSVALRSWLENRARSYVFSTAPPPAWAEALKVGVALVRDADDARARVRAHGAWLREALGQLGLSVPEGEGPIVPVLLGEAERAMAASAALFERGLFVQGIRPPTVPVGTSRLRVVATAAHEAEDVEALIAGFGAWVREGR